MAKNREKPHFAQTCVIGLGLIGASLAQAIKDKGLTQRLVAVDRHLLSLEAGEQSGLLDAGSPDLFEVIAGSDLIVIAVPVQAVQAIFTQIAQAMADRLVAPDCLITDVCSTKVNVIEAAKIAFSQMDRSDPNGAILPSGFVPAHPIAGAENSGFFARNPQLFLRHKVILCPLASSNAHAVHQLTQLWQAVGAEVMQMSAQDHDRVLAYTSHLPHLLAFNLVEQLASHDDNMDIFRYAAGGFRDFTRIAASDPTMWHDIFFANDKAIVQALDEYIHDLQAMKQRILQKNSQALLGVLGRAQSARRHFGHMLNGTPYLTTHFDTHFDKTGKPMEANLSYFIQPARQVLGKIRVAGDKSISHRSIMLGSLAEGVTRVTGFLEGEDALATLQAFRDMGVIIEGPHQGEVVIHGVGLHGLKPSKTPLYMGNSGTSMRLLAGILSAQKFDSVLTGDTSLSKRPMERVAKPLRAMGAKIQSTGEKGTAPLSIAGNLDLQGRTYEMPVASAQVKSCLLLAGLWAKGTTSVIEPEITRDHTERMLTAFGYPIEKQGNQVSLTGGGKLTACNIDVPADISSAAFFMVAASIAQDSELTLTQVGINPTRTGVIDILRLMGAKIELKNERLIGGEPVADIQIKSAQLHAIDIPQELVPLAIDEFPILFIAASCAIGTTRLTGAKELRVKESDRIAVMADGLTQLGIECTVLEDGIEITGKGKPSTPTNADPIFSGGEIHAHHDHRIAMSFTIASLRATDPIYIHGTQTVQTSFPNFADLANSIGLAIQTQTTPT